MSLRSRCEWLVRGVLRRSRTEREMEAEMRFHIAAFVEDQVRLGLPQAEAERRARIEFGGVENWKEQCREARGLRPFDELRQDVRYAVRTLKNAPAFTLIAAVTLAVGIGANASIFSLVNTLVLRPLPYPEGDRLVTVSSRDLKRGVRYNVAAGDLYEWRRPNPIFSGVAGWSKASFTLTGEGEPTRIEGGRVNAEFFRALGIAPALGRDFTAQDDEPGSATVVLIGDKIWRDYFGGDRSIVGRVIELDGEPATVIGVMPPSFQFPIMGKADIWKPLTLTSTVRHNRAFISLRCVARLRARVSIERARSFLDATAAKLAKAYPGTNANRGILLRSVRAEINAEDERDSVLIVFAIAGCVLLIACANVASLMFGRAASRQKEMTIRVAIGAGRFRLVRQLLTENLLLFLTGGSLGAVLAVGGVKWLSASIPDEVRGNLPNYGVLQVDLPVLLYTFAITGLAGLVFGLVPAFHGPSFSGNAAALWRKALVVCELSLALVVLVTAALLMKSMVRMYGVDPGFDVRNLVTAKIALPVSKYPEGARVEAFYTGVLQRIRFSPAVRAVGASQYIPFGGYDASTTYWIQGRVAPTPGEAPSTRITTVTPDMPGTLGVALIGGRFFSGQERVDSTKVILINRALARKEWPGGDPIGMGIRLGNSGGPVRTVVGVVENVTVEDLKEPPIPQVYLPFPQSPALSMYIVARTSGNSAEAVAAIRNALAAVDKRQPVYDVETMEKRIAVAHVASVIVTQSLTLFAAIALFLAAIGIYGVISYSVAARRREIGVRVALGARREDVLSLVLGKGLRLTALGLAAGLIGALGMSRLLTGMLFHVRPTDAVAFASVSILLGAVAMIACYLPARRAARMDGVAILRCE